MCILTMEEFYPLNLYTEREREHNVPFIILVCFLVCFYACFGLIGPQFENLWFLEQIGF